MDFMYPQLCDDLFDVIHHRDISIPICARPRYSIIKKDNLYQLYSDNNEKRQLIPRALNHIHNQRDQSFIGKNGLYESTIM